MPAINEVNDFLQFVETIDSSEYEGATVEVNGEVTHEFI